MMRRYGAAIILLAAFALYLWHIDTESIWHDEGWSIRAIRAPFTTPDDNTPYVYYFTGHLLWRLGAGESPLVLRYVSALIGLLTVALTIRLGRRWFGAGLAAGALVALSPLLWEYAQEVRAYVAVPVVALALLAAADAVLQRQTVPRWLWAVIFAVQLIGLYTHNLVVPLVVWLNAAIALVWFLRRDWRKIIIWTGIELAVIAGYIPWLLTQSPSGTPLNTPPPVGLALVRDIWRSYFLPAPGMEASLLVDGFGVAVLFFLAGAAVYRIFPYRARFVSSGGRAEARRYRQWLLISHALLVPVLSTVLLRVASIDFHPRYYIAAVPGTMLLVAGVCIWPSSGGRDSSRPYDAQVGTAFLPVTLIVLWTAFITVTSLSTIRSERAYQHDDFRTLAQYYATLPADAAVVIPFNAERALQDYYADTLDIQAEFVNIPLHSDVETAVAQLNRLVGRRIEFLTWFQLPADMRGMYPCLLAAASAGPPTVRIYYGLQTESYQLVQPIAFEDLPLDVDYTEVELLDADYAAAPGAICVRTDWRLMQPTDDSIRVSAALLNPIGGQLADHSADIARPDGVGTSQWHTDDTGTAFNLLRLPAGAPETSYGLDVGLFSSSQPNGYDRLVDGQPAGTRVVLPLNGFGLPFDDLPEAPAVFEAPSMIETGVPFGITLVVPADVRTVQIAGEGWQIEQSASPGERERLSWHQWVVPPGTTGEAVLRVDEMTVARYTVNDPPRLFDPPDYNMPVDVHFPDVATLVGVSLPDALTVELVWQADGSAVDYTVFVQMLSPDGRVIAQSDVRPSRLWIADEYIVDRHNLRLNDTDYKGPVTVIAGFYDDNFRRVLTENGMDHAVLVEGIEP